MRMRISVRLKIAAQEARKRKSPAPMRRLKKKARSPRAKKKSMSGLVPAVVISKN
ncbi:hypothetical protein FOA32_001214 [Streptococcus sinensis]|nr:hypothetical protein [Streptococcus sinensis]